MIPLMAHPLVRLWAPQFIDRQRVVVAGDEIVGAIESGKTTAEPVIDRIDLLAVARRIVKRLAEGVTNQRLKATAGVAIVDLRGVVRRRSRGDEIGIVAERNDSAVRSEAPFLQLTPVQDGRATPLNGARVPSANVLSGAM